MNQVVFYGAGRNAQRHLSHWITQGFEPLCFADQDCAKQGLSIKDNETGVSYDILSLEVALLRFPGASFYVTTLPKSYPEIRQKLIEQGISSDKINFLHLEKPSAKYCSNHTMTFSGTRYRGVTYTHCSSRYAISYKGTNELAVDFADSEHKWRDLENQLAMGAPTHCDGCVRLETAEHRKGQSTKVFSIGSGLSGGTKCNFRCSYCSACDGELINNSQCGTVTTLDILRYICDNYDIADAFVHYAAGEICLSGYQDEILDLWLERAIPGMIYTNMSIYNEKLAECVRRGHTLLLPSLDAGTQATYAKIKNADCFHKTVENVKKYAACHCNRVILKYILMDHINASDADIIGFLDLAAEVQSDVFLVFDYRLSYGADRRFSGIFPPERIRRALYFLESAKSRGLHVYYDVECVSTTSAVWLNFLFENYYAEVYKNETVVNILRRG